jgi:hypothetical protein
MQVAQPKFMIQETDAAADEGNWMFRLQGGQLSLATATDAAPSTLVNKLFSIDRTGTVLDVLEWNAGEQRMYLGNGTTEGFRFFASGDNSIIRPRNAAGTGWDAAADFSYDRSSARWRFDQNLDIEGYVFTAAKAANWDTAYGWGDHDSLYEVIDADIARADVDEVVTAHWAIPSTILTKNISYTLVLTDAGKTIHKASGGAGETITIPANASVAFPLGTLIAIENDGGGILTVAITTDTLTWAEDNSTGSRAIADGGAMVIQKMTATTWKCAGSQIS